MIIDYHIDIMTENWKLLDWIIVGAGPQGSHLACCLRGRGVSVDRMVLLDRHPAPLHLWNRHTEQLKMGHLRSSAVHHIDVSPHSFFEHAVENHGTPRNWSAAPYHRPKYEVFQEHCQKVLESRQIASCFRQREVIGLRRQDDGYELTTDQEVFRSRRVVLAVGQSAPRYPQSFAPDDPRVHHLLSPDKTRVQGRVVVVGGGMTGVQFCLAHHQTWLTTTLVTPRPAEVSDFDADPCWIGPKCRTPEFLALPPEAKRRRITAARRGGSVNPQVLEQLRQAQADGAVEVRIARAERIEEGKLLLSDGSVLEFDHVVLATGFEKVRPGGALVDHLVQELELPLAPCGFPLVSEDLEWAPGLFVMGGLAELSLGPVARNITGGRSAAKLILKSAEKLAQRSMVAL